MKNICILLLALTIGLSSSIPISPFIGFITKSKRSTTISRSLSSTTISSSLVTKSPTSVRTTQRVTSTSSTIQTTTLTSSLSTTKGPTSTINMYQTTLEATSNGSKWEPYCNMSAATLPDNDNQGIRKQHTTKQTTRSQNKRNSPNCKDTSSFCIYFYADHPDARSTTNEENSLFCTYFYPDNPDDDDRRIKGKYSSAIANPTNHGFVQQKPTMMGSNKSRLLSTCEDSSLFCTYSYLDHSFAGRKIKSNYTPVVPTIDAVWNDVVSEKKYLDGSVTTSTMLSIYFPSTELTSTASPLTSSPVTSTNLDSLGSTTWKVGPYGIMWNDRCIMYGEEQYLFTISTSSECMERCFQTKECTHWSLRDVSWCFFRTDFTLLEMKEYPKASCGFVPSRLSSHSITEIPPAIKPWPWRISVEYGIKWYDKCTFDEQGYSNTKEAAAESECMDHCFREKDCTHWTYSFNYWGKVCSLKTDKKMMEWDVRPNCKCGFVPSRLTSSKF